MSDFPTPQSHRLESQAKRGRRGTKETRETKVTPESQGRRGKQGPLDQRASRARCEQSRVRAHAHIHTRIQRTCVQLIPESEARRARCVCFDSVIFSSRLPSQNSCSYAVVTNLHCCCCHSDPFVPRCRTSCLLHLVHWVGEIVQ